MATPEDAARRLRTDAERRALAAAARYATVHDLSTPPERAYLEALPDGRSVVLRRLVRGLLRGHPEGLPDPSAIDPSALEGADAPRLRDAPGVSPADAAALTAEQDPAALERLELLPFPASGVTLAAPVTATYGYGRRRLAGPVALYESGRRERVDHPVDLVPHLRREGAFSDDEQADRIEAELAESAANLALARLAQRVHRDRADAGNGDVLSGEPPLPAADAPAALERLVTDGHPFHPGGKIRRGMTATDGLAYAPEFTDAVDLHFVAVESSRAREVQAGERSLTDRLYDAFPGLDDAVDRSIPAERRRDDYRVVPVHPWQYYRVIPDRYERQRADGVVVPVDGFTHPATSLLNLRTVVPYPTESTSTPPHCKLAIGVQTTNVERTVSPQAAHNGPRVTDLLRDVADDASLERVGFLEEPAATCYYPPDGPHPEGAAYHDVRHLSGLVRENPRTHPFAGENRTVVPAAALIAASPADGRPVVAEAVDRFAAATGRAASTGADADAAAAGRDLFAEYVDAVVPEQLRLLTEYGIALESHLQNSCIVFEDGRPVATLVRDFGGIRVDDERLADRGLSLEPYPDSDLDADGRRDLYRKLHYALFHNHLAELVVALVRSTPVDESECWRVVRERCRETFEAMRADAAVPAARIDADEAALFADPATHKALTAMRLRGKRHEYVTSGVPNPLAD